MRTLSGIGLCGLFVFVATTAAAQPQLICTTPSGWCRAGEQEMTLDLCWCQAETEAVAGTMSLADSLNPLTEIGSDVVIGSTRNPLSGEVAASRAFAGPSQYPPHEFAAYGILAFKRRASSFDRDRHLMFCEAYVQSLPHHTELTREPENQMVTVWPIESDHDADHIAGLERTEVCHDAVKRYGLVQAQNALEILSSYGDVGSSYDLSGQGPFLIAWAPPSKIRKEDSIALVVDLSAVHNFETAVEWMDRWRNRIQDNPDLWRDGFEVGSRWEQIIAVLRNFFDENGTLIEFGG